MGAQLKVYLETTFFSYLTGRQTSDVSVAHRQAVTRKWWEDEREKCDLRISAFVLTEAERGDEEQAQLRKNAMQGIAYLETESAEIKRLASILMAGHAIPSSEVADALHIATAAFHEMDVLLTWNCKHMANPYTLPKTVALLGREGYKCPQITTPERFMEDMQDD